MIMKNYKYDIFLSHSSSDKATVIELANRLQNDGATIWLDDWMIKEGGNIPQAINLGLENSRHLVICLSPNWIASDYSNSEFQDIYFEDPLNNAGRIVPIILTSCKVPRKLKKFKYVEYSDRSEPAYQQIFERIMTPDSDLEKTFIRNRDTGIDRYPKKYINNEAEIGYGEYLVISSKDPKANHSIYFLKDGHIFFGRDSFCEIQVNSPYVSRIHGKIFKEGPCFYYEDWNSTNGSFLDSKRIHKIVSLGSNNQLELDNVRFNLEVRKVSS